MNKTILKDILAVTLVFVLVALGVYFSWKEYKVSHTPFYFTNLEDTSTWKTYTNEEFGYSIKYPTEYAISANGEDGVAVYDPKGGFAMGDARGYAWVSAYPNPARIFSNVYRTAKGYARDQIGSQEVTNLKFINIDVGVTDAVEVSYVYNGDGIGGEKYSREIYALRDGVLFIVGAVPKDYGHFRTIVSTFRLIGPVVSIPNTCTDLEGGDPVITSLSSNQGAIGSKLEINGCNLAGFEGDKNIWIENSAGVKGILYGESDSTSKSIKVVLKSPICQKDNSYSGLPCDAELTLIPGDYKIYTYPWSKESNKIDFKLTSK
ncbi:MAG: hypothetical protein ABL899_00370 [Nitrospira sp.]